MAKLSSTSKSVIHIAIIVLNLDKWLRSRFLSLFSTLPAQLTSLLKAFTNWLKEKTSILSFQFTSSREKYHPNLEIMTFHEALLKRGELKPHSKTG